MFGPNPAVSYEERKFPYLYYQHTGLDTLIEEAEIKLPEGYEPVDLPPQKSLRSAIADYDLSFSFDRGVITVKKILINKKGAVTPDEYLEFKQFYGDFLKLETQSILLRQK